MALIQHTKDGIPIVNSYTQLGFRPEFTESYETRLERRLEFSDKNHKPSNVIAIRERPEGSGIIKEQLLGGNTLTDTGEIAYAQKAAGATPTNDFWAAGARFAVRDATSALTPAENDDFADFTGTVPAGSIKARAGGYPLAGTDGDADNTGDQANTITWAVNYTTTDFSTTNSVTNITYSSDTTPTTGEASPILFHAAFSPIFAKTLTDTLKVFVNHLFDAQ